MQSVEAKAASPATSARSLSEFHSGLAGHMFRRFCLLLLAIARKARWMNLPCCVALVAIVGIWFAVATWINNSALLPSPKRTFEAIVYILQTSFLVDALASLSHLALGFSAGLIVGVTLAIISASSRYGAALIEPISELLRPIGAIAWIPIALLLFGVSGLVPVFLIFIASVFPVYVSTLHAITKVDPRLIMAAESLGANKRTILAKVVLPGGVPMIMTGARLGMGVSWMALVAAELIGADEGLGWRVFWFQEFFRMDRVLALMILIGIIGLCIDKALRSLQQHLAPWAPDYQK